jgi:hypothetical protein
MAMAAVMMMPIVMLVLAIISGLDVEGLTFRGYGQ